MFTPANTYRFEFSTYNASTGALTNADSTPTAVLVVNGTDNAATVTITNAATGVYKGSVALGTLSADDVFYVRVTATVNSVTAKSATATARVGAYVSSILDGSIGDGTYSADGLLVIGAAVMGLASGDMTTLSPTSVGRLITDNIPQIRTTVTALGNSGGTGIGGSNGIR